MFSKGLKVKGLLLLLLGALFLAACLVQVAPTSGISRERAITTALEWGTMYYGLSDVQEVAARQITYDDFLQLSGDKPSFGMSAETPMWLVAIRGTVVITSGPPSADGTPYRREYDNLYVLLDSTSGRVFQIVASEPGKEIR